MTDNANKYVCGDCLYDEDLANIVMAKAGSKICDFCGKTATEPIAADLDDVVEHMEKCIDREYGDPAEVGISYDSGEGGWQGKVQETDDLLETIGFSVDSEELRLAVILTLPDHGWSEWNHLILSPEQWRHASWATFKEAIKHKRRFTFWSMDDEYEEEWHPDYLPVGKTLSGIADAIREVGLVKNMPTGTAYWRVRVAEKGLDLRHDHDLSAPPIKKATQPNRMSPAGISMFYGAEDFETAVKETIDPKNHAGKAITGAMFKTVRPMHLLDLMNLAPIPGFFNLKLADVRPVLSFLNSFRKDLAKAIRRDAHEPIEYVPTQAFTEYVRFEMSATEQHPIDGILYPSSKNGKLCCVLFCEQDHCVAVPSNKGVERWLEMDNASLRIEDVPS